MSTERPEQTEGFAPLEEDTEGHFSAPTEDLATIANVADEDDTEGHISI